MKRKWNREETMNKLVAAVGEVLREGGPNAVGVNRVCLVAGVSKPMLYRYFGSLNNLIAVYIEQKDYWLPYFKMLSLSDEMINEDYKALFTRILQDQLTYFYKETEMQKIILWQISVRSAIMKKISHTREHAGLLLMKKTDPVFRGSAMALMPVIALLVGGIYFMILQNEAGAGSVAGVDISDERDRELVLRTIGQILDLVWREAGATKN